jgi:uncharacterized protein YuzE
MKLEYDHDVDAAYIYLEYPLKKGQVKRTKELNSNINLDYDNKGKLLGVEVLHASKMLTRKALLQGNI